MPRRFERVWAVLCYLGALWVPVIALAVPEWAFTLPSGLLLAAAAWLYGRRRSPYLAHHGREGFQWSLQANAVLAAIALLSKGLWLTWDRTGWAPAETLWHLSATGFRWTGWLVFILTVIAVIRAARGETRDVLTASR